jgi:enamine deaminase RidA (YjgF/YER057c/UK114 family)
VTSPHRIINPPGLAPPTGFAHAVVAAPGRTVYLCGQAAQAADGSITGSGVVAQFEVAAGNLLAALAAAGGQPDHLVSIQIFVTDAPAWRAAQPDLGAAWRRHFGRHYPAVGLFQVAALFDPAAQVELVAIAVIPD